MRTCATLLIATLAACAAPTHNMRVMGSDSPFADDYGPTVRSGYARVRTATARFRDLDAAVAAGYERDVPQCLADPAHGAMGYHHINRANMDKRIEIDRPEILLYEQRSNGTYALNGVEYIIPYRVWPRDSVPPKLLGRDMLRADGLNLWYTHMWVWKSNPAGLFADWNPNAQCRAR